MVDEIMAQAWRMQVYGSWKRAVDSALGSGMPVTTWCRLHGISVHRFKLWRARLSNPDSPDECMDCWHAFLKPEVVSNQPKWKKPARCPEAEESAAVDLSQYLEVESGITLLVQGSQTGGVVLELDPDRCIMMTLSMGDSDSQSIEMEVA